jgi:hypothetical protein
MKESKKKKENKRKKRTILKDDSFFNQNNKAQADAIVDTIGELVNSYYAKVYPISLANEKVVFFFFFFFFFNLIF